jgi:hypothetical protein
LVGNFAGNDHVVAGDKAGARVEEGEWCAVANF